MVLAYTRFRESLYEYIIMRSLRGFSSVTAFETVLAMRMYPCHVQAVGIGLITLPAALSLIVLSGKIPSIVQQAFTLKSADGTERCSTFCDRLHT